MPETRLHKQVIGLGFTGLGEAGDGSEKQHESALAVANAQDKRVARQKRDLIRIFRKFGVGYRWWGRYRTGPVLIRPHRSWVVIIALFGPTCGIGAAAAEPAPSPHVSFDGSALTFDFPSVQVGVAEYEDGPTGATVILFRKPVLAAVDVRGGAPGTVNTDLLRLGLDDPVVNAITLAGGSAYGLSAATGVANALKEKTRDPADGKTSRSCLPRSF
jgi:peptidase S58-like protein